MKTIKIPDLQVQLQKENAEWVASFTSLSGLDEAQLAQRLGARPPGALPTPEEKEKSRRVALAAHETRMTLRGVGFPAVFDWRNNGGQNYVTPIKNQGGCGSCVAFGSTAAVESKVRIQKGAAYDIDLSEAHLFYCLNSDTNGCQNGWWPDSAYDNYKSSGVARESFFPYVGSQQTCKVAAGWENTKVQITGWKNISDVAQIKDWLSTQGPMSACFEVFADFYNYRSGIYSHVTGDSLGWHCVCVVGYDEGNKCWICKNSWDTGWGESGFFRIKYGQCSIEHYGMWGVEGIVDTSWLYNKKVIGLWTIDQDYNAYAYIQDEGWKRVFSGNPNSFYNILTQLINAKNKGTTVNVRIDNGVIVEIYS